MPKPRNPLADTYTAKVERAARKGAKLYVVKPTIADEVAADAAWERAQARYRLLRSTSVIPFRCKCGEWNDASRPRCRVCGCARVA